MTDTRAYPARPTKYQRTHRPYTKLQVLCYSQKPLDVQYKREGVCPDCGAWLKRGGRPHRPDREGLFGWVERYRDGSFRVLPGARNIPYCKVCEQHDVPAVHTTPLIGEICYGPVFTEAARP